MPPKKKQKGLRLTPKGAASLQAWLVAHGISQTELGVYLGIGQMQSNRIIRRIGLVTTEQVGKVVGFVGGELTAVELVGKPFAAQVPKMPLIDRTPRPPPPPVPSLAPFAPEIAGTSLEVEQVIDRRFNGARLDWMLDQAEDLIRDPATSRNLKASLILGFIEQIAGKARQREKVEKRDPPIQDAELQRRLEAQEADLQLRFQKLTAMKAESSNGPIPVAEPGTPGACAQPGPAPGGASGTESGP